MTGEIIVIKQLPVIEEQLKQIQQQITDNVSAALSLECNDETYKTVKVLRAELSKQFRELEQKRIDVKKKILMPYEQFESIYKTCVTDVFKPADNQLASRIAAVEDRLKGDKEAEVREFFSEYCRSLGIDFLTFEMLSISITMTASLKNLKEQVKKAVDEISESVAMIATLDYSDEVFVEYKNSLNVASAVVTVNNRHKAILEEQLRREKSCAENEKRTAAEEKVSEVLQEEMLSAPQVSDEEPETPAPTVYRVAFCVETQNLDDIKALKSLMTERGMKYEQL